MPWTTVEMEEMTSSGLLCHPSQRADRSIPMIGDRDNSIIFEAAPAQILMNTILARV